MVQTTEILPEGRKSLYFIVNTSIAPCIASPSEDIGLIHYAQTIWMQMPATLFTNRDYLQSTYG